MARDLDQYQNIPQAFFAMVRDFPKRDLYSQSVLLDDSSSGGRRWQTCTYEESSRRVCAIAGYLRSLGIQKGDRIAILSQSRPEWMEADLAILALGAVSISVYQSLPAEDVGYILYDSEARVVFAENQEQVDKLRELLEKPCAVPGHEDRAPTSVQITIEKVISFERVETDDRVLLLEDLLGADLGFLPEHCEQLTRDDYASFVYTSGTTGPPKGVMQTHGNHLANCRQAWNADILVEQSRIMLFLPLAHSFAKLMGYLGYLTEAELRFAAVASTTNSKLDAQSLTKDLAEAHATVIPIVPRLLEKMRSAIEAKGKAGGLQGFILKWTLWAAKEMYVHVDSEKAPGLLLQMVFSGTAGIRQKLKIKLFGSDFVYSVSGGAKLNPDVARFFDALGIEILEGYGLTETCVATNINRLGSKKIGSVGPVLDEDIELRLGDDGEILFRGPNVSKGYFRRPTATAQSWDSEGWFHTGDLGAVDPEGYLSIVGRKKEILVTSYGKNVAPEDIEGQLKSIDLVSQAVLVGDGRAYCTALLTLDEVAVASWAKKNGYTLNVDIHADSRVFQHVWKAVEAVNEDLANYESVRKFTIVPEDFTVENGLLTPTFKVKRKPVFERYAALVEQMYVE